MPTIVPVPDCLAVHQPGSLAQHGRDRNTIRLDREPECDADVPVTRIATLADLGDYLDPDGEIWPADECHDDPAHHPGCSFFVNPAAT
jgi:hypothetical protein